MNSIACPRPVQLEGADPTAIAKAIKDLWREFAPAPASQPDEQAVPVVSRVCVGNFVVYLDCPERCPETEEILDRVAPSYPARTILLIPQPDFKAGQVRTLISARCFTNGHASSVLCSERVTIYAAPGMLEWLAQTLLGLFVEDLPRHVWWQRATLLSSPLYARLAPAVDRMIVDSRYVPAERGALRQLLEARRALTRATLTDLNWGRLTPWREVTAQIFDLPERYDYPQHVEQVDVVLVRPEVREPPVGPFLYLGFLASRLGWQLIETELGEHDEQAGNGLSSAVWQRPDGGSLRTHVSCISRPGSERHMVSVTIQTQAPRKARFRIERSEQMRSATLTIEADGCEPVSKAVSLEPLAAHQLISNELNYGGRDQSYGEALPIASRLFDAIAR